MSFRQFKEFKVLINRVNKRNLITMIACIRCAMKQKKCRISSLFKKCNECIKLNHRCELTKFVINFDVIDKIMKKLEREKIKTKTT